jgi:hypothetical protein
MKFMRILESVLGTGMGLALGAGTLASGATSYGLLPGNRMQREAAGENTQAGQAAVGRLAVRRPLAVEYSARCLCVYRAGLGVPMLSVDTHVGLALNH